MSSGEDLYVTPEGYYDVPFAWVYDGAPLVAGQNYLNQSIQIKRGYGDFLCRRMVGIQSVVNPNTGQYQIYNATKIALQTDPEYPAPAGLDDYVMLPEVSYPEQYSIRFDLYDALAADPPIVGTYVQTNYFNSALNESQGDSDGAGQPISVSGNGGLGTLMVIGGVQATSVPSGEVLVYTKTGAAWLPGQFAQIIGPYSAPPTRNFGFACSTDGTTIAIGAPSFSTVGLGAVYIYTLVGSTWTLQQTIAGSTETATQDLFGWSVWVNGNNMLIGAPGSNDGATGNGAVYYFTKSGGTWTLAQKFTQSVPAAGAALGGSIAVNGTNALIGSNGLTNIAYFFALAAGSWSQSQAVTQAKAGFGNSVAFGSGGTRAYVATGAAAPAMWFVYDLIAGTWTLTGSFTAGSNSNPSNCICGTDQDVFIGCTGPGGIGAIYHYQNPGSGFTLAQIINETTPTAPVLGAGIALAGTTLFGGYPFPAGE